MQNETNDAWQMLTGNNLLIRKRGNVSKSIQKMFPIRVGISFLFNEDETFQNLAYSFEDELMEVIEGNNYGILTLVLTGKNNQNDSFRECVLYTDPGLSAATTIQDIVKKYSALNAGTYSKKDARWRWYKSIK